MNIKKHLFISLFILLSLLTGCSSKGRSKFSLNGMFYSGKDGKETLFIDDKKGVLEMTNQSGDEELFNDIYDGDIIEVIMDVIYTTPTPNCMPVYDMKVIKRGTEEDLPMDKVSQYEKLKESRKGDGY